jgi:hypothetical protein
MEAKRGMDATDPRPALLGALVAVLWTNIARAGEAPAMTMGGDPPRTLEAFGCFTVADVWTFVRAEAVVRLAASAPRLGVTLSWSREHTESFEAEAIWRVLRWIVGRARV